ncbi:accessory gene regulator B family protein [Brevibacillus sp. MER 51]|uniref:accessory gene regulator ArgB-like protein n=1 Tax=Brevibacillus sp. MER 51 TaxID=2939560 RepID=UPI00203BD101|nr:accessory gene regulator B family protein [Brevibacillus sp. MER 51]MCM3141634.1 accessory gene regulator B family protein [Brevibacillus sp. MER 51]
MIEKAAERMAKAIKAANPEETSSVKAMQYPIAMTINLLGVVLGCLIIGVMTGRLSETFTAFISFALLRRFSGGYHAHSLTVCVIISVLIFTVIPFVPLTTTAQWILKSISCLLVLFLSPANCEENEIRDSIKKYFRIISILLVVAHLFTDSTIIILSFFVQALLLIDARRLKEVIIK